MSIVLETNGLTAGYGRTTVLREVDLQVEQGTVAALVGANGAGKTTMLRALAGVVTTTAGKIIVGGDDVTGRSPAQRVAGGLCLIPEGRGVFPTLTVNENLRLQVPPGGDPARIERAFERFPVLRDFAERRAGSMSGGQQQMLALSRCFVSDPRIVLLDEVSMGLAPRVIDEIFTALRGLADDGVTLLLVEQYVSRALAMSDDVHLLTRGRLTFSGKAADVDASTVMHGYLGAGA